MPSPIGLLVVHGIGNQSADELRDALAARLADAETSSFLPGADDSGQTLHGVREIRVDGAPVHVYEANWADVSHPDNPPIVRDSRDVVTEFYKTVRSAWYAASRISPERREESVGAGPKPMVVWMAIAFLLNALLISIWVFDWTVEGLESALNNNEQLRQGLALGLACFCIYSLVQGILIWRARRREAGLRSRIWGLLQLPLVILWGFYRPVFFFLGAEMLFFLSIAVFLVYPVNLLGWLLAQPFRGVGYMFQRLGAHQLARWVHRFGSVLVVLPTQSYLQAVKATGNLFSILFSEKGALIRVNAFLWFFWVFLGFLLLLLLSEVLFLIPLGVFLPDSQSGQGWFDVPVEFVVAFVTVVLPLYLLFLRLSLPAIDLVLDVSNYHLASMAERRDYFVRLDRGLSELAQRGCKTIHVLAHSLGSVIAYDWLQARRSTSHPVVMLHTIGSPLDKFWYIDHGRLGRDRSPITLDDKLVGAWTNYWAISDPVSGKLHRYDTATQRVNNVRLRWLGPYLWSHARYWTHEVVIRSLRASLVEETRSDHDT